MTSDHEKLSHSIIYMVTVHWSNKLADTERISLPLCNADLAMFYAHSALPQIELSLPLLHSLIMNSLRLVLHQQLKLAFNINLLRVSTSDSKLYSLSDLFFSCRDM